MRATQLVLLGFAFLVVSCKQDGDSHASSASNSGSNSAVVPTLTLKELMGWVVDPNAARVFAAVGTDVTAHGEVKIAPKNDAEWNAVRNNAAVVLESANLLMLGDRARDQDEWPKRVKEFAEATAA